MKNTIESLRAVDLPRIVRPRTSYRYRCPHCGKVVIRECGHERPKQWRKSFCEATGKNARIQLLPAIDEVTRTVRALKRAGRWPNAADETRRE